MPIPTVSLSTAKLLKEAGFLQESEKWYVPDYETREGVPEKLKYFLQDGYEGFIPRYRYAAPSTDELLVELPNIIQYDGSIGKLGKETKYLEIHKNNNGYKVMYKGFHYCEVEENKSLPEALAQMWIFLKKEGLLDDHKMQM